MIDNILDVTLNMALDSELHGTLECVLGFKQNLVSSTTCATCILIFSLVAGEGAVRRPAFAS